MIILFKNNKELMLKVSTLNHSIHYLTEDNKGLKLFIFLTKWRTSELTVCEYLLLFPPLFFITQ